MWDDLDKIDWARLATAGVLQEEDVLDVRQLLARDPASAAIRLRALLEMIVQYLGRTETNVRKFAAQRGLASQIKYLKKVGLLPPVIAAYCHQVRVVGNIGSHDIQNVGDDPEQLAPMIAQFLEILRWLSVKKMTERDLDPKAPSPGSTSSGPVPSKTPPPEDFRPETPRSGSFAPKVRIRSTSRRIKTHFQTDFSEDGWVARPSAVVRRGERNQGFQVVPRTYREPRDGEVPTRVTFRLARGAGWPKTLPLGAQLNVTARGALRRLASIRFRLNDEVALELPLKTGVTVPFDVTFQEVEIVGELPDPGTDRWWVTDVRVATERYTYSER